MVGQLEERNKNTVRRFVQAMSARGQLPALDDLLAPRFRLFRRPFHHLESNAGTQGFADSISSLRRAFTDPIAAFDTIIAEGYRVAIRWRTSGVHQENLFGIAPTGRKFSIWQAALFHLAESKITEAWFMAEELALLLDLGVGLPGCDNGRSYRPEAVIGRAAPEALWDELRARASPTREDRNKIGLLDHKLARLRLKAEDIAAFEANRTVRRKTSGGSRLIHEYGMGKGFANQAPQTGIRDRLDHIDDLIGEGDLVFQRYTFSGNHTGNWYDIPPTGRRIGTAELSIERFDNGGANVESWYFVDELGLVLQMDAFELLLEERMRRADGLPR
jgi:predicted ester cyclase